MKAQERPHLSLLVAVNGSGGDIPADIQCPQGTSPTKDAAADTTGSSK